MGYTVFLGNLPSWVTDEDIQSWLQAENLVADSIRVIRDPRTQESKGFAYIETPNEEEMNAIIRRFNRAPLEGRLLRANPAHPPRDRSAAPRPAEAKARAPRPPRPARTKHKKAQAKKPRAPQTVMAEELAKIL